METIQFIQTTPFELQNAIIEAIKNILPTKTEDIELLTQKEAANFLKVTTATIIRWQKDGIINSYGIASERRYKKNELISSLELMKH